MNKCNGSYCALPLIPVSSLQMELKMLKEARDRERAHRENAAVDAESSQAELVAE